MNPKVLLLLAFLFLIFGCKQQSKTEIPLPEHPRPDFERPVWQNLNGYWKFKPDSTNVGLAEKWQNEAEFFDQSILVPFSWASPLSEVEMPKVMFAWYYRTFTLKNPANWQGKDTYLVFCASDFNTTVWVNGIEMGSHSGGYVPFDFNISNVLKEGENNIVVRVDDQELDNRPSGKQYYGNAKGMWQTVYLEARPENYISHIKFTPDIDKEQVTAEVNLSSKTTTPLKFSFTGKNNDLNFSSEIASNQDTAIFTIPIKNMKLWDLENPFLYEVTASLSGPKSNDEVSTYFGMRKISAMKVPGKDFEYVALNNKPIYMKLTLDQSYHP
ncbi:MAG TPA: hypothetical protein VKA38_14230, partial [Draconibacterium sp.]|nr:hypothetical protein [Draconibacterium sp.]